MKFLTWVLIFCFASQAMASTVREGLEAAMNDYEYDMVVEWDQKDTAKAEVFTKKFTEKLDSLYQQGLSNDVLLKYVESRALDKKVLANIQAAAALTSKKGSSENIVKALQDNMGKLGNRGASWTGGVADAAILTGLLAIGALIVYQLVWNLNHRCATGQMEESCGTDTYCDGYSYDEDGNEYCSSTYSEYSCENIEVCLRWEKY